MIKHFINATKKYSSFLRHFTSKKVITILNITFYIILIK